MEIGFSYCEEDGCGRGSCDPCDVNTFCECESFLCRDHSGATVCTSCCVAMCKKCDTDSVKCLSCVSYCTEMRLT